MFILIFILCIFSSVKFTIKEIYFSTFNKDNDLLNTIVYGIRLPQNLITSFVSCRYFIICLGILLQIVIKNLLADFGIKGVCSGINVISLFTIIYSYRIQSALVCLNESLAQKIWNNFKILGFYITIGLNLSLFCIISANILTFGEKTTLSLGFNLRYLSLFIYVIRCIFGRSLYYYCRYNRIG